MADEGQSNQEAFRPLATETLEIPSKYLAKKTGFSLDIGSSMVKVVYATDKGTNVRLHCCSYPRSRIIDAISFIKKKCQSTVSKGSKVYTCGVGSLEHTNSLAEELGIVIEHQNEMDCCVDAYRLLSKSLPFHERIFEPTDSVKEYVSGMLFSLMSSFGASEEKETPANAQRPCIEAPPPTGTQTQDMSVMTVAKPSGLQSGIGPAMGTDAPSGNDESVLLCVLGSGALCLKIVDDSSYQMLDSSTRCGKMFVGLGRLLTGAKNYEELIELASRGDAANLNIMGKHMKKGAVDEVYKTMPDDVIVHCFGQGSDGENEPFSNEDKAAALLNTICQDIAQLCHWAALATDTRTLVMCGGFPGYSQLVRDEIGKMIGVRCILNTIAVTNECHFAKYGAYYGAIGALLKSLQ